MKRLLAIPLLVLYLTAVSGMMVQIHFCGDELSSWRLNQEPMACCCEDSADGPAHAAAYKPGGDCCSDKTITLKITEDQQKLAEHWSFLQSLQAAPLPAFTFPAFIFHEASAPVAPYAAHAPPGLWQYLPLYKLYGSFTYYG